MQRFSFVVLPTLLLLVIFSVGCQNDHEERIAALENQHAEKIAQLEKEVIFLKSHQASDDAVIDALFYKVVCDAEHEHSAYEQQISEYAKGIRVDGVVDINAPLNASLVFSDSETGVLYDLQPLSTNPPYRAIFRHLICDGVSGGIMESVWSEEEFDPDKHPIQDLTLTNAILVTKLCSDNLNWEPVLEYADGMAAGTVQELRDRIYTLCDTHRKYMLDYQENSTGLRAYEFMQYRELENRLRPPKETAEE